MTALEFAGLAGTGEGWMMRQAPDCPRHPTKSELSLLLRIAKGLMSADDVESVLRTAGENLTELAPDAIMLISSGGSDGNDGGGDSCYYLDMAQEGAQEGVRLERNHGICKRLRQVTGVTGANGHARQGAAVALDAGREVVAPFTDGINSGYIALSWASPPGKTVQQHACHLLPGLAELAGVRLGALLAQMQRQDEQCKMQAVTESRHTEELRVSEHEKVAARELAARDELTGLQNRRGFLAKSEQCLLIARRKKLACAVVFADVNGLKLVNDQLGHAAGDALIRDAASIFSSVFRHADVVGRVGGDEFAAFTFDNATPGAIIDRIEARIAAFNASRRAGQPLSLSIGVINCDIWSQESLADYLGRADVEMYLQKRSAKACTD